MMKIISNTWKDAVGSKLIANFIWETRGIWGSAIISIASTVLFPWFQTNWYIPVAFLFVIVVYLMTKLYRKDEQIKTLDEKLQETNRELINLNEQIACIPLTDIDWLKSEKLSNYGGLFWFVINKTVRGVKTELDPVENDPQFRKLINNNVLKKISNHGFDISPEIFDYLKEEFDKMNSEERRIIEFELNDQFGYSFLHNNISQS